jgi:hypothetical protein
VDNVSILLLKIYVFIWFESLIYVCLYVSWWMLSEEWVMV